jgi:hypothetical protein
MTQEQFEEEKMPDPEEEPESHIKWLNKQLRKEGHDELEPAQEIVDEPEVSEEMLKKIEDGTLKKPIENVNKDVEWERDEEKEVTEEMIRKRKRN